jgi:hypothetical protein
MHTLVRRPRLDLARDWAAVEPARRAGRFGLGGAWHRSPGAWLGFGDLEERQVGAVVADDADAAHRLIEELTADTSIAHALASHGERCGDREHRIAAVLYLARRRCHRVAEVWQAADRVATAELLMRAMPMTAACVLREAARRTSGSSM